jgi:predicted dehydrogenase
MSLRPFRIGIAGAGFGAAVHAPALRTLPGVEIVAIAASTRQRADSVAASLGISSGCVGIAELLALDLDAVTIALPPLANEEAVAMALGTGVAILAEKPLAVSAERAADFAARAAGRTAAVDFEFRELASFAACKRFIDGGTLGGVRDVRLSWQTRSGALKHRAWSWKTDAARGGGVVTLLGTHALYMLEYLFGTMTRITGRSEARLTADFAPPGATAAEDTVDWSFDFASGARGTAAITNAGPAQPLHRWEIAFERGTAIVENAGWDYMAGFSFTARDAAGRVIEHAAEPQGDEDGRLPPFRRLAERFVAAAQGGLPCQPDFAAGARVQSLIAILRP